MKQAIKTITAAILITTLSSGCASYYVMEGSKKQIAMRKAILTNNEAAIKAIRLGDDGVGVGIDVGNLEALTERPLLQIGAALLDAASIYAINEGIERINDDDDDKEDQKITEIPNISGNNNSVNIINGDGNQTKFDTLDQTVSGN